MKIEVNRTVLSLSALAAALVCSGVANAQAADPVRTPDVAPGEAAAPSVEDPTESDQDVAAAEDSTIVVTGTSIRGVAPVGSQLIQVDQNYIQDSGVQSTAALLATIPQFDSFASRPTPISSGAAPTTPPSLRTLGPGATLSLLNSHRLVGIGTLSTVADPTSLPIAAIARVEVLTDGASATYGSDAIGGVLNVILRKDLDGVDARASVGVAQGYTQEVLSLVGGKTWATGSILIGGQYQHNNGLLGGRRDFITENFVPFGGTDNRTRSTALPNVTVGGTTFGFNGAGFTAVPNLTSAAQESDLIPASRKWTAVLNAEQRLGENVRLFADGHYGNLKTIFRLSPASDTLSFTITDANPFFRTPVPGATSVDVQQGAHQLLGHFHENIQDLEYWGVSGGGEIDFSEDWSGQLVANYGHSHSEVDQDVFDNGAFFAAVASTDPATAYDPFTGRTSPATIARITDAIATPGSTQTLFQATAAINGSLFALPGGDAKLALGGEYRRETYEGFGINGLRSAPMTTFINSDRDIWSAYGEVFLPLVGEDSGIPLMRRLDVSAALRHDRYSDFGSTTNPKVGVNWGVVDGLTLRGTYAKSFHAPSLADIRAIDDLVFYLPGVLAPGVLTPPGVTTPQNLILLAGGNLDLQPEKATTWSFGADFNPTFAPRLRASATYFDIDYTDRVVRTLFDFLPFVNPGATNRVVIFDPTEDQINERIVGLAPVGAPRFAPGEADLLIDARRINLGGSRVKGLDVTLAYSIDLGDGTLLADVNGTHLFSKITALVPGGDVLDELEQTATPEWRWRTHLGWKSGNFRANAFWSHLGGYNNVAVNPVQRVDSFDPIDVNFALEIPNSGFGKNFEIQFDIQNVFDEDPPFLLSGNGASALSSPIGRLFQVSVRVDF